MASMLTGATLGFFPCLSRLYAFLAGVPLLPSLLMISVPSSVFTVLVISSSRMAWIAAVCSQVWVYISSTDLSCKLGLYKSCLWHLHLNVSICLVLSYFSLTFWSVSPRFLHLVWHLCPSIFSGENLESSLTSLITHVQLIEKSCSLYVQSTSSIRLLCRVSSLPPTLGWSHHKVLLKSCIHLLNRSSLSTPVALWSYLQQRSQDNSFSTLRQPMSLFFSELCFL